MSSIDKYVEGEARSFNPRVRVVNDGVRIKGYIEGNLVFSIADRYGYLSSSERSIIKNSIKEYEAEEQERIRREQIRIENERIAARNELKSEVLAIKKNIRELYLSAQQQCQEISGLMSNMEVFDSLNKYNLSPYAERAQILNRKVKNCIEKIDNEYRTKIQEVETIEKAISDDSTKQKYIQQRDSLKKINFNITNVMFPITEIEHFKFEIEKLKEAIAQIEIIENELNRVANDGLIGAIATSALKEIKQFSIGSLEDINKLITRVQEKLGEIRNLKFQKQSKEISNQISLLNGILKSCSQLREYLIIQPYEATNNRSAIIEMANRVLGVYSELDAAVYTTCDRGKIKEVYELAQNVLVGYSSDNHTLEHLKQLLEDAAVYKREDQLQASNYSDYLKKVDELCNKGVPVDEMETFDPLNYMGQKKRLNEQLLNLDIQEGISRTRTSFMLAWKVMEDMGYRLLYQNMGSDGADALACEGVFVKPGCEGVVWQIVASDCNINRKLIGIKRTNGLATSIERVREVAEITERSGEDHEFYERYAAEGGGELTVKTDVYVDSPNSEKTIQSNGCFELSEEGERCFNLLVKTDNIGEKMKWETRLSATHNQTMGQTKGMSSSLREQEYRKTSNNIGAQRAKK